MHRLLLPLVLLSSAALADDGGKAAFTPDDKIQKIAEAYALDAVDFVAGHFHVKLDWSDASIKQIETIMDGLHRDLIRAKPSDQEVNAMAKKFGSYIGEVYRKNHGATWGQVEFNGQRIPGLKKTSNGAMFWPAIRARNRLIDGEENNVWDYYQVLIGP